MIIKCLKLNSKKKTNGAAKICSHSHSLRNASVKYFYVQKMNNYAVVNNTRKNLNKTSLTTRSNHS